MFTIQTSPTIPKRYGFPLLRGGMSQKSLLVRKARTDLLLDLDPRSLGADARQANDLLHAVRNHASVVNDSKLNLLVGDLQALLKSTVTQTEKLISGTKGVAQAISQAQMRKCSTLASENAGRRAELHLQINVAARRVAFGFDLLRDKYDHLVTMATAAANVAQTESARCEGRLREARAGLIDVQAAHSHAAAEYRAATDGLVAAERDAARASQRERQAARCAAFARCAQATTRAVAFMLCLGPQSPRHCDRFSSCAVAADCAAVVNAEDAQREKRDVVATKMRLRRRLHTAVSVIEEASNRVARTQEVLETQRHRSVAASDCARALIRFSAIVMRVSTFMGQLHVVAQLARNEQQTSIMGLKLSEMASRPEGDSSIVDDAKRATNRPQDSSQQSSQVIRTVYARWAAIEDVCADFASELVRKMGTGEVRLGIPLAPCPPTVQNALYLLNIIMISINEEEVNQEPGFT